MDVPRVTVKLACIATTVVRGALYTDVAHCKDRFPKLNIVPPNMAKRIGMYGTE
jgi:hypothetical protein